MSNSSRTSGRLRVFLGYAAGVGKTYQMMQEAHALRKVGRDVVIGYFERHARPDTIAQSEGLETVPLRVVEYRGVRLDDMDTDAILARRPQVAVVDEFPHTNPPGSACEKRWQDVLLLLDHGIDVLTTMNVQHLESLNDQVFQLTGVRVRETVPDWVLERADEVIMVDLTPRALLNRLDRGVVYAPDKAEYAKQNFFRERTLVALRELTLRQTAHEVEQRQAVGTEVGQATKSAERILVYLTSSPATAALVRRGKRVADYLQSECIGVVVCPGGALDSLPGGERAELEKQIRFAGSLHVTVEVIAGDEPAEALVAFARRRGVTKLYLTRPITRSWSMPFGLNLVQKLTRLARDMEVTIVAERRPTALTP